jgi:hypothetical protein
LTEIVSMKENIGHFKKRQMSFKSTRALQEADVVKFGM